MQAGIFPLGNACLRDPSKKVDAVHVPQASDYTIIDGPPETGGKAINVTSKHVLVYEHPGNVSQYSIKFYVKFDHYRKIYIFETNVGIRLYINANGTFGASQYLHGVQVPKVYTFDILLDNNIEEKADDWIQLNGIKVTDVNERKKRQESLNTPLHKWILLGISFDMQPYQQNYKFYLDGKPAGSYSDKRDLAATTFEVMNTLRTMEFTRASFSCAEFRYDVESDDFFANRDFDECSE